MTRAVAWLRRRQPWSVLVPLLLCEWAAVGVFAATVRHNGWLFYQGGDETFFYTAARVLAGGHIPPAGIGYGWSYLLAPLAGAAGPNFIAALPALVVLQGAILLPIALYCVYAIAARIGGRMIGYATAALWIAAPFAAIPLWDHSYHAKYVEQFLPQALGLSGLGDFPSMVCLLIAALFCIRAIDTGETVDAAAGGLAAGFAIGIKPANALFLAGPALAFLAGRRIRETVGFGTALVPPLLALVMWKYRGLGHVPVLTQAVGATGRRLAAGPETLAPPLAAGYLDLSWSHFHKNYVDLRELFFAVPVLQALPILGFLAAARRSAPKALVLAGWLAAFLAVKSSSPQGTLDGGTLLRLFMPGFPPLLILSALASLFVVGRRLRRPELARARPPRTSTVALAAALFALLPLLLFLALPPLRRASAVSYARENVTVPVDGRFSVDVRRTGGRVVLSWHSPRPPGVRTFSRIFRSYTYAPAPDPASPSARDGIRCHNRPSGYAGARDCWLEMPAIGQTRAQRFVERLPPGPWVYRVALAANWRDDTSTGDIFLVSEPARVPPRR